MASGQIVILLLAGSNPVHHPVRYCIVLIELTPTTKRQMLFVYPIGSRTVDLDSKIGTEGFDGWQSIKPCH